MKKNSSFRWSLAGAVILCSVLATQVFARPAAPDVTFTGRVTCMHCTDLSQHKGFTPWSWAMYRVSQGDEIVLVTQGKTYRLQGDRDQLSKYIEDKAIVSGHLNPDILVVTNITRPQKEK
jgi:hypothetical protein